MVTPHKQDKTTKRLLWGSGIVLVSFIGAVGITVNLNWWAWVSALLFFVLLGCLLAVYRFFID